MWGCCLTPCLPRGGERLGIWGPTQNGAKPLPRLRWRLLRLLAQGLQRRLGTSKRGAGPKVAGHRPPFSRWRPAPDDITREPAACYSPPPKRSPREPIPHKMAVGLSPRGSPATLNMVAVYPIFLLPSPPQLPRCFE